MPSLGEIQAGFLRAVFDADARDAAAAVTGDGVAAEAYLVELADGSLVVSSVPLP